MSRFIEDMSHSQINLFRELLDHNSNKKVTDGHRDYLGCFARNWDVLNTHSKNQLLKLEAPETESGRSLIYVCPECADIGCGAFGCKITKDNAIYKWSDFAYENGYEDPILIPGIGPFEFEEIEYEDVIKRALAL
jgi:hypothetical protein